MMAATDRHPVELVVDRLSAAGCNPRRSGDGWSARCPVQEAHKRGDRNPSLSIGEGADGKALIYCHAGCTLPDVARALELHTADLFPERPPSVAHIGPSGRIKATYDYHDAAGELLFQVVRLEPKSFRQRRRTAGGWVWNTQGVPKVLYHLPQVLRAVAERRTVWVVEGEKDVENLQWAIGDGVATCNPGGAGKWLDIHTEAVRGAPVRIIADDDAPGRAHARQVAAATGGTVYLPAEGHLDISRHLGAGLGLDELRLMPDPGDEPDPEPEPATEASESDRALLAQLVDWKSFWAQEHAEEEWVVWPLVPAGRGVALFAPAKTGKSLLLLALIAGVVTGRCALTGRRIPPRRVLYCDYEMTEADLHERLESLGYGPDDDLDGLSWCLLPTIPPLDGPEGAKELVRLAELVDAELVVIDTFSRAVQGDENDADTVRGFYRWTGLALKAAGRAWLRADHSGKDVEKGQRGSSAKNDDVDVVQRLVRNQDGWQLQRTHSRVRWVPEATVIRVSEDIEGVMRLSVALEAWPEGTGPLAKVMDQIGVPLEANRRTAGQMVRDAGHKARNEIITAALRWRRQRAENDLVGTAKSSGTTPGTKVIHRPGPGLGDRGDQITETTPDQHRNNGDQPGDQRGPRVDANGDQSATRRGAQVPSVAPERRIF